MNRETWLNELAAKMGPRFQELGWPLPPFRVSIGFTSSGRVSHVGGECWHKSRSADQRFEILIAPHQDDAMTVAAILAHELAHAAVGFEHKHKGDFAKCVAALGLVRPFTSSVPGDAFKAWAQPFLDELGALPHRALMFDRAASVPRPANDNGEGEGDAGDEYADGGSSNQKKKQTTRMLKASCTADVDGEPCGYTVRLSKKWAQKLGACCPAHGALEVEGADDGPEEQDAA